MASFIYLGKEENENETEQEDATIPREVRRNNETEQQLRRAMIDKKILFLVESKLFSTGPPRLSVPVARLQ